MKGLIAAFALCCGGLTVTATPALAEPPVWVVSDADSELVLFGSVHLLPPNLSWRPAALARALRSADDLWFELPIDAASQGEVAQLAAAKGVLPPGQTLTALLPPKDAARLKQVCAQYGVNMAQIDRLRPWMAEVLLSATIFAKAGAGIENGVELGVSADAPPSAARKAFETPAQQIEMLSAAPLAEQIVALRQSLDEMDGGPEDFDRMVRAWMAGDVRRLETETIAPMRKAAPALFKRLVTDRNARWTAVLDKRLKGRGHTVVVVGMGHLVGKDGVPARLKALGYSVKGP